MDDEKATDTSWPHFNAFSYEKSINLIWEMVMYIHFGDFKCLDNNHWKGWHNTITLGDISKLLSVSSLCIEMYNSEQYK